MIDHDDPRLTMYALGELPKDERADLEAALRADPALVKKVAEIQRVANLIEEDLRADELDVAPLTVEQKERIVAGPAPEPAGEVLTLPPRTTLLVRLLPYAAAAGLLGVAGLTVVSGVFRAADSDTIVQGGASALNDVDEPRRHPRPIAAAPQYDEWSDDREADKKKKEGAEAEQQQLNEVEARRRQMLQEAARQASEHSDPDARERRLRARIERERLEREFRLEEERLQGERGALENRQEGAGEDANAPTRYGDETHDGLPADATTFGMGQNGVVEQPRGADADPAQPHRLRFQDPRAGADDAGRDEPLADPQAREGQGFIETRDQPRLIENAFKPTTGDDVMSTFSIDVDTAAYANVRQSLRHHQLPSPEQVRIEELINYFPYDDAPPTGDAPFASHVEVTGCPWAPGHRLVRVGLKGRELAQRPPANLVFLLDVSGSMDEPRKLPLVKQGLRQLVEQLGERDRVAIVVYAGASGLALPSTSGDRKQEILAALDRLDAGGSTNGGAGIELAYRTAIEGFKDGGVNRVILCTDGDWNVGITDHAQLEELIAQKARSHVFLSVLGFGIGGGDATCERLADRGNGNYASIDSLREAKKVLVEQAAGTLVTIAKDVKVQVEWNPRAVAGYRLIGYENRVMTNAEFRDDARDAGEIGAGHTVTALYEVEPAKDAPAGETFVTVRLRYKEPEGDAAKELAFPVRDEGGSFDAADEDTRFAAAVAGFGMLLRGSSHRGQATFALVRELAQGALGKDVGGHRAELVELIDRAAALAGGR